MIFRTVHLSTNSNRLTLIIQVATIQKELEDLEERANMLNRERQKDISGITYINDRIKAELRKKDAIAEREWKGNFYIRF